VCAGDVGNHPPRFFPRDCTGKTVSGCFRHGWPWSGAGADLVLNGHEHFYESFERKDASGKNNPTGLREINCGNGGRRVV